MSHKIYPHETSFDETAQAIWQTIEPTLKQAFP
jgi:hypothetical protein